MNGINIIYKNFMKKCNLLHIFIKNLYSYAVDYWFNII